MFGVTRFFRLCTHITSHFYSNMIPSSYCGRTWSRVEVETYSAGYTLRAFGFREQAATMEGGWVFRRPRCNLIRLQLGAITSFHEVGSRASPSIHRCRGLVVPNTGPARTGCLVFNKIDACRWGVRINVGSDEECYNGSLRLSTSVQMISFRTSIST